MREAASEVGESRPVEYGARLGYAGSGVLHLLMGIIALRIAVGGGCASADQSGALGTLADQPLGTVLLWLVTAGFVLLALWQATEAVTGAHGAETTDRVKAVGKCVVYAALAWSAFTFATGGGASSRSKTRDFTATLLQHSGGRLAVAAIGLAILGAGGYHVYKGWTCGFLDDLAAHPGAWAVHAGRVGYLAKGVALGVVGILFVIGAYRKSAAKTTGLDGALRALRDQPAGTVLLALVALGIAAFGVYCFARARYAKV